MHEYDKSSKWLIQHHGDSILRLAGVNDIESWKPLQAELIQPRRLPDGLNLLAVTQFLARLRYNDPGLFNLLGGRKAMIESPLLQEILAEERLQARREAILTVLTSRFGIAAVEVEPDLKSIDDGDRLNELIRVSASCRSLKSFRKHLSP